MDEGIIIEFTTVHMPTYQEIKSKSTLGIEEYSSKASAKLPSNLQYNLEYSYMSLNIHPYNDFRPLYLDSEEGERPWVNQEVHIRLTKTSVIYLCKHLSIAVCYNRLTQSHSIVLLKPNVAEILNN